MSQNETMRHSLKETGEFLANYCAWLLGSGSTCIRLEKNVARMAQIFGVKVQTFIMPRHVEVSLRDEEGNCLVISEQVVTIPIDFNINTCLSRLSWDISDKRMSPAEAESEFRKIISPGKDRTLTTSLLVSVANASFCRLFGGDPIAMVIVAIATFIGFRLKCTLMKRGIDSRLVFFFCSFVSSVLGASDMLFSFGTTPAIALGTSILYLVPGIPFLNSFSDLLYRHYICAAGRFMDALILTCCLSAGLCLGMILMNAGMF